MKFEILLDIYCAVTFEYIWRDRTNIFGGISHIANCEDLTNQFLSYFLLRTPTYFLNNHIHSCNIIDNIYL